MTPPELVQIASRHQVLLEGLKTGKVRAFLTVFTEIEALQRDTLNALEVETLSELARPKLERILDELETAQAEIFDAEIDRLLKELPAVAKYEAEHEVRAIQSLLPKSKARKFKTPRDAAKLFEAVKKRPIHATGDLLETFVENWSKGAIKAANNAIRIGYDQGQTVPQILKRLKGTGALNYKDGITAVNKRQAATVVRTAVQHTAAAAREVTYEENSDLIVGYTWISTLDGKTSKICRSLDGKHYKTNDGPKPPIHPNCRSTTAPDLDSAFDFLDDGATRSSQDGYVNADLSYYAWLKKQNPDFQDTVLGPIRGKLLREGGLSAERFADLQLDKNFEPLTLDEMRALEPIAFRRAGL